MADHLTAFVDLHTRLSVGIHAPEVAAVESYSMDHQNGGTIIVLANGKSYDVCGTPAEVRAQINLDAFQHRTGTMAENTLISWADHTLNIWAGCTRISNGPLGACVTCYAAHLMDTRLHRVEFGGPGAGIGTRSEMKDWRANLRKFERKAEKRFREEGHQTFVFVNSLSDFFDNHPDCGPWRQAFFDALRALPDRGFDRPHMVMLLLTKRPQNILKMVKAAGGLPPICALGTTTENRTTLEVNGSALLAALGALAYIDETPARFGFLSCEPLMEALDLSVLGAEWAEWITWIIGGGETDQGAFKARPTNPGWGRSLLQQSLTAGAVFHWKQNGEWLEAQHALQEEIELFDDIENRFIPGQGIFWKVGKKLAGRRLDCVEHNGRPVV